MNSISHLVLWGANRPASFAISTPILSFNTLIPFAFFRGKKQPTTHKKKMVQGSNMTHPICVGRKCWMANAMGTE
ncbi:MAG: hypothetical protein ACI9QL_004616 [Candidatus Omnitrophota bacterium]|jgi:hypothetical protein